MNNLLLHVKYLNSVKNLKYSFYNFHLIEKVFSRNMNWIWVCVYANFSLSFNKLFKINIIIVSLTQSLLLPLFFIL